MKQRRGPDDDVELEAPSLTEGDELELPSLAEGEEVPELVLDMDELGADAGWDEWPCPDDTVAIDPVAVLGLEPVVVAAFASDPPSTLTSLLRRGPLEVDIYSVPDEVDEPPARDSDVFPRVETFEDLLEASRKAKGKTGR